MKKFKGIGLLLLSNILIFITLSISFSVLSEFVLPAFGIDLRGSIAQQDLLWAFVLGFGGAFISLAFSKQMARAFIDCTQITEPRTQAEVMLFETVQKISSKLGITMPEVWIYDSPDPNAFATGPSKNNSMVAVSTGLMNHLNEGEVRAVIAHEMGHLLGSRHTHACVWNGDNTAIDGCAGFTEGSCPLPPLPPGGGTIMSYCANTSVGIDFNLGFGPQPAAVILNNIDATGNCLNPLGTLIPPTAVCTNYTAVLDSSGNATIVPADVDGGSYDDIGIVTYAIDIDTFDCNDIGDNDVLLTVTDTDGLSNTCLAIVKVEDDTDPVVTDCPADFTVMVEGLYDLPDYTGVVTATDNCPVTITQDPAAGTQLPEGAHTITLTAEDGDGNEGSCSFVITVDDILGVGDNTLLSSIVMYPNPTNEIVRLINPQNLELEAISIYDLTGRLIKTVDLRDMGLEISVDLSGLASANYMVIIQGAQSLATKQLIKR